MLANTSNTQLLALPPITAPVTETAIVLYKQPVDEKTQETAKGIFIRLGEFFASIIHSISSLINKLIHLFKHEEVKKESEEAAPLLAIEAPPALLAIEAPPALLAIEAPPALLAIEAPPVEEESDLKTSNLFTTGAVTVLGLALIISSIRDMTFNTNITNTLSFPDALYLQNDPTCPFGLY